MFSMFSSVSGHFTKGLVLGTLLPVLLFLGAAIPVLLLFASSDGSSASGVLKIMTDQAATLSVVVVALTGLLYNMNRPLIRFYEGYPWKETFIGKWRKRRHVARLSHAKRLQTALTKLRSQLGDGQEKSAIQQTLSEVSRVIASEFPGEELVLPTRLGNVIRNFEEYPRQQYGMQAIPLWPRLVAVINKDYGATIDETKISFDFFLNCSMLAAVFAAEVAVVGVFGGSALTSWQAAVPWAVLCLVAAGVAYALYIMSVTAASLWGTQVKGAFDLYRKDLLKQLGYEQKAATRQEERVLWKAVSRQIVFGDPVDGTQPLPYILPKDGLWERLRDAIWPAH